MQKPSCKHFFHYCGIFSEAAYFVPAMNSQFLTTRSVTLFTLFILVFIISKETHIIRNAVLEYMFCCEIVKYKKKIDATIEE